MHINKVKVMDFWVSYDIEDVDGEIQIVSSFFKNGYEIHKIYSVGDFDLTGANMVARLLDNDFAKDKAERMIKSTKASKHSPFR